MLTAIVSALVGAAFGLVGGLWFAADKIAALIHQIKQRDLLIKSLQEGGEGQ